MDLLLDTHCFIWLNYAENKIPESVMEMLADEEYSLLLSSISIWEICQKYTSGKLELHIPPEDLIAHAKHSFGIEILDFTEVDNYRLQSLPKIHKDPFDRMLICQAIENQLAIVTDDKMISSYPIKIIW
ncbi:MAG: type II toxin-antitoxin system VapC family toxin [Rickettsiales bacterium]